jgi:hypothetical protein
MQKYTGRRRTSWWLLLFYCVPYSFLAMWTAWSNPPAGRLPLELAMTAVPLGLLAVLCGWTDNLTVLVWGNVLELLVPLCCVLAVSMLRLPNSAGVTFSRSFKPLNAVAVSVVAWALLFLLQSFLFWLLSVLRKRRG